MNGGGLRPEKKADGAERVGGNRRLPGGGRLRRVTGLWPLLSMIIVVAVGLSVVACGASIQAVYEGDIRFEHCMALDAQADVKPQIKRACWHEWVSFYTYGQTRDRVRHAQLRIRQLSGVSEFVAAAELGGGPLEAPEPDNPLVSAPPATAGAGGNDGGAPLGNVTRPRQRQQCIEECEAVSQDCGRDCRTHGCEKSCAMELRSCVADCPAGG